MPSPPSLRLLTLGTLAVTGPGGPVAGTASQPKALALLAMLARSEARGMSRDRLLAALWPEGAEHLSHRLTQLLYSLRRDLGADDLLLGSSTLRLNGAVLGSDVVDFIRALESGDFAAAIRRYGGPFLEGFHLRDAPEFERWGESEREHLAARHRATLEALAQRAEERRDWAAAAGWWRQRSQADPLDANAVTRYLMVLETLGDYSGARRFIEAHRAMLSAEYDEEPDPALAAWETRLRSGSRAVAESVPLPPAVAVLPFVNLTPDQDNQYFGEGMTDELTSALSRIPGLRVASRFAARRFRARDLDPREVADALEVGSLVWGSVRKVGNRIRISAELVDGRDGRVAWSDSWERTLDDVFVLQEEISRAIVTALPITPDPGDAPLVPAPTNAIDAYTLYLRGRFAAHKRTPDGLALAIEYFEQAVERDPRYALAHAGLAESLVLRGFVEFGDQPPMLVMPRAKQAALDAVRLDPRLPEAHTWLGVVQFLFDWDWQAAEAAFRRAVQLRREWAYGQVWYGILLGAMGHHEEALRRIRYGETLEPTVASIRLCTVRVLYWSGAFDEALALAHALRRDEPELPLVPIYLSRILSAMGRDREALETLDTIPANRETPYSASLRAGCLAAIGHRDDAAALCATLRPLLGTPGCAGAAGLPRACSLLGDFSGAMQILETLETLRSGVLAFLAVDHLYAPLRAHPPFEALLTRLKLPALGGQRSRAATNAPEEQPPSFRVRDT